MSRDGPRSRERDSPACRKLLRELAMERRKADTSRHRPFYNSAVFQFRNRKNKWSGRNPNLRLAGYEPTLASRDPPVRKRLLPLAATESNSESANLCAASTSATPKTEKANEEGCFQGARFFSAERNHRPVNARRREIGSRAFAFLASSGKGLRRSRSRRRALWFERELPGSERDLQGSFRTPKTLVKTLRISD